MNRTFNIGSRIGASCHLLLIMLLCLLSGCLTNSTLSVREPSARMLAVARGGFIADSTTTEELIVRLRNRDTSFTPSCLQETANGKTVPFFEESLLVDVVSVIANARAELVVIIPGPGKDDQATARLFKSQFEAVGIPAAVVNESNEPVPGGTRKGAT